MRWAMWWRFAVLIGISIGCSDQSPHNDGERAGAMATPFVDTDDAERPSPPVLIVAESTPDGSVDAGNDDPTDANSAPASDATRAQPAQPDAALEPCEATAPAAALQQPGTTDDVTLTIAGRRITPAGRNLRLEGFPGSAVIHPNGHVAYVASMSADDRRLYVININDLSISQNLSLGDVFYGLLVSPDGSRLYAAGGAANQILVFTIDETGQLTPDEPMDAQGFIAGMRFGQTPNIIWAADFGRPRVRAFDMNTRTVLFDTRVPALGWDIEYIKATNEVFVSSLNTSNVFVVDAETGELIEVLDLGIAPGAMVASPTQNRIYIALSGQDEIAVIDTQTREVVARIHGAPEPTDVEGRPLANINLSALAIDAMGSRLFAARGTDNAVSIFDTDTLDFVGAFPTAEYPTGLAMLPGQNRLLVTEGRGGGSGPSMGRRAKSVIAGSTTLVDLDTTDLTQSSAQVLANYAYPQTAFPFECEGRFPIPSRPNQRSPIKHVILLVKENKTFDCVFGDLDGADADVDPNLVRYGREITPNLHALARQYALSDNFYTEVEDSDVGHIMLTSTHITEFVHRIWVEKDRSDQLSDGYQFSDNAHPESGNFFTHLMDNDISIRIYGEIVGILNRSPKTGRQAVEFSDDNFPGGGFVNYGVTDAEKARHIAEHIQNGELAQFTYILLPNDHTVGTRPGFPTPESMVADNDIAVGIIADTLSKSPFWEKSALFIVQDDPQGCRDHVDAHRSFVMVVSPWAKKGHISHVLGSFVSVFATIERILNVPAMGRGDALAAPLWDMFTATPDMTAFDVVPRLTPVTMNTAQFPGAAISQRMSFRGPDRNPGLAVVLDAYRLWRMGRITRAEAQRRIDEPSMGLARWAALLEESFEETFAFDAAYARYAEWLRARGKTVPTLSD